MIDRENIIARLEKEVKKTYLIKTTIYNNGKKVNEDITEHREPGIKISMEMADEILALLKEQEAEFTLPEKCATISVYGASDDLVEVEGDKKWADEYDCYDQDIIIYFNDCTVLRMHYDGAWRATVENKGASEYTITPLIENDDYYSDLFKIHDTWILNVRKEKAE